MLIGRLVIAELYGFHTIRSEMDPNRLKHEQSLATWSHTGRATWAAVGTGTSD